MPRRPNREGGAGDDADRRVAGKYRDRPRRPPMLDNARRKLETTLRGPFESDARYGPHLPNLGTPVVPNALLDRLSPPKPTRIAAEICA